MDCGQDCEATMDCQRSGDASDVTEASAKTLTCGPPVGHGEQPATFSAHRLRPHQRQTRLSSFFSVVPRWAPAAHTLPSHSKEASGADRTQERVRSTQCGTGSPLSPSDSARPAATKSSLASGCQRSKSSGTTASDQFGSSGRSDCCVTEDLPSAELTPAPSGQSPAQHPSECGGADAGALQPRPTVAHQLCFRGAESTSKSRRVRSQESSDAKAGQEAFSAHEETAGQQGRDMQLTVESSAAQKRVEAARRAHRQLSSSEATDVNLAEGGGEDAFPPTSQCVTFDLTGVRSGEEEQVGKPSVEEGSREAAVLRSDSARENEQTSLRTGPRAPLTDNSSADGNHPVSSFSPAAPEATAKKSLVGRVGRTTVGGSATVLRQRGWSDGSTKKAEGGTTEGEELRLKRKTKEDGFSEGEAAGVAEDSGRDPVPALACPPSRGSLIAGGPLSTQPSYTAARAPCAVEGRTGSARSGDATKQTVSPTRRAVDGTSTSVTGAASTVSSSPGSPVFPSQSGEWKDKRKACPVSSMKSCGSLGHQESVHFESTCKESKSLSSGPVPLKAPADTGSQRATRKTLADFFSPKTNNAAAAEEEFVCCPSTEKTRVSEATTERAVSSAENGEGKQSCDIGRGSETSDCPVVSGRRHYRGAGAYSGEPPVAGSCTSRRTGRKLELQNSENTSSSAPALLGVKNSLDKGAAVGAAPDPSGEGWEIECQRDLTSSFQSRTCEDEAEHSENSSTGEWACAREMKTSQFPTDRVGCAADPSCTSVRVAQTRAEGTGEGADEAEAHGASFVTCIRGGLAAGHTDKSFPARCALNNDQTGEEAVSATSTCSPSAPANLPKRPQGRPAGGEQRQCRSAALCPAWSAIFKRSPKQGENETSTVSSCFSVTPKEVQRAATTQAPEADVRNNKRDRRPSGRRSEACLNEAEKSSTFCPFPEKAKETGRCALRRSLRVCVQRSRPEARAGVETVEVIGSESGGDDDDLKGRGSKKRLSSTWGSPGLAPSCVVPGPPTQRSAKKARRGTYPVLVSSSVSSGPKTDEAELKEDEQRNRALEEERRKRQEAANRRLLGQAQQQQREAEEEQRVRFLVEGNASWASSLRLLEDGEDEGGYSVGVHMRTAGGAERRGARQLLDSGSATVEALSDAKTARSRCSDRVIAGQLATPLQCADFNTNPGERTEKCSARRRRLRRGTSEDSDDERDQGTMDARLGEEEARGETESQGRATKEHGGEAQVQLAEEEDERHYRGEREVTGDEARRRKSEMICGKYGVSDAAEWVCRLRDISWPEVKVKLLGFCGLTGPLGQHATFFVSQGPYTFHSYNSILRILHKAGIATTTSARRATCILTNDEGYCPADHSSADAERGALDPASATAVTARTEEDEMDQLQRRDYLTPAASDDLLDPSGICAEAASSGLGPPDTGTGVAPWKNLPNSLFDGPPVATESMLMRAMKISLDEAAKRFRPVHDKSGILVESLVDEALERYAFLLMRETRCSNTTRTRDSSAAPQIECDRGASRADGQKEDRCNITERTAEGGDSPARATEQTKGAATLVNNEETASLEIWDAETTYNFPGEPLATSGAASQDGRQLRLGSRKRKRSDAEGRGSNNHQGDWDKESQPASWRIETGSGALKPPRVLWLSHLTETWPRAFEPVCLSELAGNNDVTLKLYRMLTAKSSTGEGNSSREDSQRVGRNGGRQRGSWLTTQRGRRERSEEVRVIILTMPLGYGGDRLIELLCYACGYQAVPEQKLREEKRIDGLFLCMAANAQARTTPGARQESGQGRETEGIAGVALPKACSTKQAVAAGETEKTTEHPLGRIDLETTSGTVPGVTGCSGGLERSERVTRSNVATLPLPRISVYDWWALTRSDQRRLLQRNPAGAGGGRGGGSPPVICVARWRPGDDADSARQAVEATVDEAVRAGAGSKGRKDDSDEDLEGHAGHRTRRKGVHVLEILPPSREALVRRVLAVASAAIGASVDRSFVELLFAAAGDGRLGARVRNPVSVAGILHTLHLITRTHLNSRLLHAAYRHESQRRIEEQQRKLDACLKTDVHGTEETSSCSLFHNTNIPPVSLYDREPPYCTGDASTFESTGSALTTSASNLVQNFVLPPLERPLALPFALAEVPLLASWRLQQEQPKSLLLQLFGRRNSQAADSLAASLHSFDLLHEKFVCNPGSQWRRAACETIAEVGRRHGGVEEVLDAFTVCARVVRFENEVNGCLFSDIRDSADTDTDVPGHRGQEGEGACTNSSLGVTGSREIPMIDAASGVIRALPLKTVVHLSEDAASFVGTLALGGIALLQHGRQGAYAPPPIGSSLDAVRKQLLCEQMIQQEKLQTRRRLEKAGESSLKVLDLRRSVEEVGHASSVWTREMRGKQQPHSTEADVRKSANALPSDAPGAGGWGRAVNAPGALHCSGLSQPGDGDRWLDDDVCLFDIISVSTIMNSERQLRQFFLHEGRTLEKKVGTARGGKRSRNQRKRVATLGEELSLQRITAVVRELQAEYEDLKSRV